MPRALQTDIFDFVEAEKPKRDNWKNDLDEAIIEALDQGDHICFILRRLYAGENVSKETISNAIDDWNSIAVKFETPE